MKRLMLVVAAMTAASAFADRVIMKSGSVLTGSGAVVAGDKVKFTSEDRLTSPTRVPAATPIRTTPLS